MHQIQALNPCKEYLQLEQMVEQCHEEGMKVHVWTVNDEKEALRLKKAGVDAIITNHPGKMRDVL